MVCWEDAESWIEWFFCLRVWFFWVWASRVDWREVIWVWRWDLRWGKAEIWWSWVECEVWRLERVRVRAECEVWRVERDFLRSFVRVERSESDFWVAARFFSRSEIFSSWAVAVRVASWTSWVFFALESS